MQDKPNNSCLSVGDYVYIDTEEGEFYAEILKIFNSFNDCQIKILHIISAPSYSKLQKSRIFVTKPIAIDYVIKSPEEKFMIDLIS